jgi:hypothetical protein
VLRREHPLPHNLTVTDDAAGPRPWPDPVDTPSGLTDPWPVPDLAGTDDGPPRPAEGSAVVSDEDRTRYGLLLDRAAERGLLSPYEYQVRLGDLAEATSLDQLKRIVTELPAFTAPVVAPTATKRSRPTAGGSLAAERKGRRSSPWVLLVIVVIAVLVSLVIFTIYAEHVVHGRNTGVLTSHATAPMVSAPRL